MSHSSFPVRHILNLRQTEFGSGLIEFVVALSIVGIIYSIVAPLISTASRSASGSSGAYATIDQRLGVATAMLRLLSAAVPPGPTSVGHSPVSAFQAGSVSGTKLVFFADTDTPNGPAEVIATCSTATSGVRCSSPTTFTISLLPAVVGSCPHSISSAVHCIYRTSTARIVVRLPGASPSTPSGEIFTYSYLNAYGTLVGVCSAPGIPVNCTSSTSASFAPGDCLSGSASTAFVNCPVGEIAVVSLSLSLGGSDSGATGVIDGSFETSLPTAGSFMAVVG